MKIVWISKISKDLPHKVSRLKMSEALSEMGHDVTLFMVKKFGEKENGPKFVKYISTVHFPILSGFFFGLIVFFYFPIILSKKKIDIIIIDCTKIWLPFAIPLKILGIPLILDIRTLPIDREKSILFNISLYLSRYIVDGISTITQELYNELKNEFNIKTNNIGIWSSGVTLEDFEKNETNDKKSIDSIKGKFVLIYHGDYSPTRGIENLIKSIKLLNPSIKNSIKLLIIGMPKNKIIDLMKICKKEGVEKQIDIFPKMEYIEITNYVRISDAGIIPLPPENNWWRVSAPLKTLEYLAAGKPIIATNIPFHRRIFDKCSCGILLESAKPEVLATGVTNMFKKQNLLKDFSNEGKKMVEEYYSWKHMAQKFEKFLIDFKKLN